MKTYIIGFFIVIASTLILDGMWLHTTLKSFYEKNLNGILDMKAHITPALIFYILYTVAVLYFVIFPLIHAQADYVKIFLTAAFFGLTAYGTYDLTNHATIKNWPYIITVIDMAWGAFLTGTVATFTVWTIRLLRLM